MNSLCVCDVYGGCPQGCDQCAVCSGPDDDPLDGPDAELILEAHDLAERDYDLLLTASDWRLAA
jgi:hypothetical protein